VGKRQSSARERTLEIVTVLVLSITAVLTAWCGFESSQWGGEESISFSQASSARIEAGSADSRAQSARQYDLSVYIEWVRAQSSGDAKLADYIQQRFSPEFRTAFDDWMAGGRKQLGPFAMASYVPPGTAEAKALNAKADAKFQQALVYNTYGDHYSLLTVLFALVLFLTAISQRELKAWMQYTFLGLALVAGLAAAILMLTFPIDV
jgi:hypothetical protein